MARWMIVAAVPAAVLAWLLQTTPPLAVAQLDGQPLEPVLVTLTYWLTAGVTAWLLGTQLLYTLADITDAQRLTALLQPITLPLIRRVATGATGLTLTLSTLTAPAIATTPEPTPVVATADISPRLDTVDQVRAVPTPRLSPIATSELTASYAAPLTWLVRHGDNLWTISGTHLAVVLDRQPSLAEHDAYWRLVVDHAQDQIRSGNPDLIYPGEEIVLPPTIDANITP